MLGRNQVSDKELHKTVSKRPQRGGGEGLTADVQRGTVTVKGKIRYEAQRRPILKILTSIAGVLGIVDQLQLEPRRAIS
ncbi:MAG: BON domain-containing protein [Planctomycetes bacterium]|nr:BON domain-containing protein [Planctomycetota bacterium]